MKVFKGMNRIEENPEHDDGERGWVMISTCQRIAFYTLELGLTLLRESVSVKLSWTRITR